jgi:hypothetical protein
VKDLQELEPPKLAPATAATCEECGASLASDQRYCLNCGARHGDPRLPIDEVLASSAGGAGAVQPPAAPPARPGERRDWTPLAALGGLALLAVMLTVGVLIGKTDSKSAAGAQVIKLTGGGGGVGGSNATVADTTVKSDWPAGKKGFTIEIGELPKKGTQPAAVAAAKSAASSKGAPQVGVLDSDGFGSLPPGKYVVYSGSYSKKADAEKALKGLKRKFPQAKVVEVSDSASSASSGRPTHYAGKKKATLSQKDLQNLGNLNGNNYEKQSKKLPQTTVLPGAPPPTDNQAPGGGSGGGTVIK